MGKRRVLVLEDEPPILESVVYALETEGFSAVGVGSCAAAQSALGQAAFDLIIMDVGLPDGSGMDLCKTLRRTLNTPIIFLTARGSEVDRIVGLEIGGDDYVVKPFSPRELTARVRAVLRRAAESLPRAVAEVDETFLKLDEVRRLVLVGKAQIQVSATEWNLLRVLMRHPERVLSREQLMELAWDDPGSAMERTVDAHVKTLRQKLHKVCPQRELIVTHRGFGYSYSPG
jgi:two-component system catabolic regulation response regulator CreB